MPYYSWKSANKLWREKGEEATKDERERKESVSDPAIHQAYIYPLLYVSPIDTNSCGEKKERILFLSFRPSAAVHGNPAWHRFSPIFLRLHSFSQSSDRRRCCTPFTQIRVFIYLYVTLCAPHSVIRPILYRARLRKWNRCQPVREATTPVNRGRTEEEEDGAFREGSENEKEDKKTFSSPSSQWWQYVPPCENSVNDLIRLILLLCMLPDCMGPVSFGSLSPWWIGHRRARWIESHSDDMGIA